MLFSLSIPAIRNLSGVSMYGKEIKVTLSKHTYVSMPKDGDVRQPVFIIFFNPLTPVSYQGQYFSLRYFSLQYQYNTKQASDENKEKYLLGDY